MSKTSIILLHSPLVGPNSVIPTADAIEMMGVPCSVPFPFGKYENLPEWEDWTGAILANLNSVGRTVIVGHSMSGLLAARLASEIDAVGMICLDANIPPETGKIPPVEPEFRDFLNTLPVKAGHFPKWNDWWPVDVFGGVEIDPQLRATIIGEIPKLPVDWFDASFDMPDWSSVKRGYIRTSRIFAGEANRAEALGWPTIRLKGTHLHPATEPKETAQAILDCCRLLGL